MKKIEINIQTGKITEREMTPEEIAQIEAIAVEQASETQLTIEERLSDIESLIENSLNN